MFSAYPGEQKIFELFSRSFSLNSLFSLKRCLLSRGLLMTSPWCFSPLPSLFFFCFFPPHDIEKLASYPVISVQLYRNAEAAIASAWLLVSLLPENHLLSPPSPKFLPPQSGCNVKRCSALLVDFFYCSGLPPGLQDIPPLFFPRLAYPPTSLRH